MSCHAAQTARILAHLKHHTITPLQALKLYGCFRLGARIWDLRRAGYDIHTTLVETCGKRVARYRLAH